jgi:hypothetical protein
MTDRDLGFFSTGLGRQRAAGKDSLRLLFFLKLFCCWGWASYGGTVGGWDFFMGPHLMLILYIVGKNLKDLNA